MREAGTLKAVVAAALTQCRAAGATTDALELAYAACLLEETGAWGGSSSSPADSLRRHGGRAPPEPALAAMAERLSRAALAPDDAAAAATARLQLALEAGYKEQQELVQAEQAAAAGATARLAAAVAYKKVRLQALALPAYQAVFEALVDYVAAAAGLAGLGPGGAPRAQVSAAVDSVLPLSGLAHFLTLPSAERLQQMEWLARVVAGICLFNSSSGAAPSPLSAAAPATQLLQGDRLLATLEAAVADAAAALDAQPSGAAAPPGVSCTGPGGGSLGAALFCCQAVAALRQLAGDLQAGLACCRALDSGMQAALAQASQLVAAAGPAALPKDAVFPLFETAGRLHQALAGELRLLLVRARLWEGAAAALTAAAAAAPGTVPAVLGFRGSRLARRSASLGASSAAAESIDVTDLPADIPAAACAVPAEAAWPAAAAADAQPGAPPLPGAAEQQLALSGLCPVSLATSVAAGSAALPCPAGTERPLVARPAQPQLGCIRYSGRLYGFSSPAALAAFVASPELVLDAVAQAAHAQPLLVHLLGLACPAPPGQPSRSPTPGAWPGSASSGASGGGGGGGDATAQGWWLPPLRALLEVMSAAPVKVHASVQTATHVCESHIDVSYEWNEWAMRRRILALANLAHKATHGSQTLHSHFRRDGGSQTWQPKAAACQTRVDGCSSVPKKLRYVTGLRGGPASQMRVLSLSLDVAYADKQASTGDAAGRLARRGRVGSGRP